MTETALYPLGYGRRLVTMDALRAEFQPKMHPEMWRRLEAWLISEQGHIGIGSGWRSRAQQLANWLKAPWRFARPGNSFHEEAEWESGIVAYAAVDLVARNGSNKHRSPTWAESDRAKPYGLHAFIGRPAA